MDWFRYHFIKFLAGRSTIVFNAEVHGDLHCKGETVILAYSDFYGSIHDVRGEEIVVNEDGSISKIKTPIYAEVGE